MECMSNTAVVRKNILSFHFERDDKFITRDFARRYNNLDASRNQAWNVQ